MQLNNEQIQKFKELHKNGEFNGLSEKEIKELAQGVADFYSTLFKISLRIKKEEKNHKTA